MPIAHPVLPLDALQSAMYIFEGLTFEAFVDTFDSIALRRSHVDADQQHLTVIRPRQTSGSAKAGFSRKGLPLHTDASSWSMPPQVLGLYCVVAASDGGDALLADGRQVVSQLNPDCIKQLSKPGCASFSHGARQDAPESIIASVSDASLLRFRQDGLEKLRLPAGVLDEFSNAMDHHTKQFPLLAGSGYIVSNWRYTHGRTDFVGDRRAIRLLGDLRPNVDVSPWTLFGS